MFGTETVRVRPVGCYGPHEYYSAYRGVIPIFVYRSLTGQSFTVHQGHRRIFDYVEDTCRTFANIMDNFLAGEVYNVGSQEDWDINIEELAKLVLEETGASHNLINFKGEEGFTTRVKIVDFSKARRDLNHKPTIDIHEGLHRYVQWVRGAYDL
jgi:dTDP-glucose 4,6-dehydratase